MLEYGETPKLVYIGSSAEAAPVRGVRQAGSYRCLCTRLHAAEYITVDMGTAVRIVTTRQ